MDGDRIRGYGYAGQNPYMQGGPNAGNPGAVPTMTRSQSAPAASGYGNDQGRDGGYGGASPGMQPMFASILSRDNSRQPTDAFDPNSFPSLTQSNIRYPPQPQQSNITQQQQQQQQQHIISSGSLSTQQQQYQVSQQMNSSDDFRPDDFPALGRGGGVGGSKDSSLGSSASGNPANLNSNPGSSNMFASSNVGANSQSGISDGSAVSGATAAPYMTIQSILESIQTVPGCLQIGPRQPSDPKMMAKYGLMGLLESIQQIKQSDSTLLLGTDLPSLGLNLSSENLYLNFDTPFDAADSKEPKFTIPPFYMMNIPQNVKQENIAKFSIETLFYIFYQMPRDVMQVRAALELYRRQWLYHGELKLWMRLRAPAELERDAPNVQLMHFDTSDWKEKYYLGPRDILMRGMLTEEEIRAPSQQRPANVNPAGVSPSPNPNGVGGL